MHYFFWYKLREENAAPIPINKKGKKTKEELSKVKKLQYVNIPVVQRKSKPATSPLKTQDAIKKKLPSSLAKQGKTDSSIVGIESEKSISEENKKFLTKLANAAEMSKVDYTYDQNGRIVPLSNVISWNPIQE